MAEILLDCGADTNHVHITEIIGDMITPLSAAVRDKDIVLARRLVRVAGVSLMVPFILAIRNVDMPMAGAIAEGILHDHALAGVLLKYPVSFPDGYLDIQILRSFTKATFCLASTDTASTEYKEQGLEFFYQELLACLLFLPAVRCNIELANLVLGAVEIHVLLRATDSLGRAVLEYASENEETEFLKLLLKTPKVPQESRQFEPWYRHRYQR